MNTSHPVRKGNDRWYYQLHELDIELYTDEKNPPLEQRVERLLMEQVGTEDADDFFKRSIIRMREENLPQLSGPEYIKTMPETFEDFIIDCWKAVK